MCEEISPYYNITIQDSNLLLYNKLHVSVPHQLCSLKEKGEGCLISHSRSKASLRV